MTTTDIRAEALAGRWQAILIDHNGFSVDLPGVLSDMSVGVDPQAVAIVRGFAIPTELGYPIPATAGKDDVIYINVEGDDTTSDETRLRGTWIRAEATAAGLNAAGKEQRAQAVLSNIESISDPDDEGVALVCRKCGWNSGFTLGYSLTDQAEIVRQWHIPTPECLIASGQDDADAEMPPASESLDEDESGPVVLRKPAWAEAFGSLSSTTPPALYLGRTDDATDRRPG